ncbi:unnamed protein product, partial [Acanthoscelides obtectus]
WDFQNTLTVEIFCIYFISETISTSRPATQWTTRRQTHRIHRNPAACGTAPRCPRAAAIATPGRRRPFRQAQVRGGSLRGPPRRKGGTWEAGNRSRMSTVVPRRKRGNGYAGRETKRQLPGVGREGLITPTLL